MSQSQKEAAEYAEVLMAYSRGAEIQMRGLSTDPWTPMTYPLWDFARFEYRAVPKPVEAWVWLHESGDVGSTTWPTKESAEKARIAFGSRGKAILMREVTE